MVQNQFPSCGREQILLGPGKYLLLHRHPVLLPLFLLICASIIGIDSFSTDSLFPLFTFLGISTALPCLSLAIALGIAGILTSIVSFLEWVDRHNFKNAMFPQSKEQSYANHN